MIRNTVFIGAGTNLGNRQENLKTALIKISGFVKIEKTSSIYETQPVDYEDQGWFLNLVVQATTELQPVELLGNLKNTEVSMGRQPTFSKGPRIIDLDILLYSDLILTDTDLIIPHPEMHRRSFVLTPLNEIAPEFFHPELKKNISSLLTELEQAEEVKLWNKIQVQ